MINLERLRMNVDLWMMNHIGGHRSFNLFGYEVTVFGWNAMQFAVQIMTAENYWCFRPPNFCLFRYVGWYLYRSPDATSRNADLLWCGRGWDSWHLRERQRELKEAKQQG